MDHCRGQQQRRQHQGALPLEAVAFPIDILPRPQAENAAAHQGSLYKIPGDAIDYQPYCASNNAQQQRTPSGQPEISIHQQQRHIEAQQHQGKPKGPEGQTDDRLPVGLQRLFR